MRIYITSIFVDDQAKAFDFYNKKLVLGVQVAVPVGEHRWLTVVSREQPDGTGLCLVPSGDVASEAKCALRLAPNREGAFERAERSFAVARPGSFAAREIFLHACRVIRLELGRDLRGLDVRRDEPIGRAGTGDGSDDRL